VTRGTFVVLGGGLAGATAVATLRNEGFDGRLVLIGAEHLPPYERPPLSKGYLRGEQAAERIAVRPEKWFGDQEIETRFGETASALDLGAGSVALSDADPIRFDALLLATGSRARRPAIPGADLSGV